MGRRVNSTSRLYVDAFVALSSRSSRSSILGKKNDDLALSTVSVTKNDKNDNYEAESADERSFVSSLLNVHCIYY